MTCGIFPDQESPLYPLHWTWTLDHWTTREDFQPVFLSSLISDGWRHTPQLELYWNIGLVSVLAGLSLHNLKHVRTIFFLTPLQEEGCLPKACWWNWEFSSELSIYLKARWIVNVQYWGKSHIVHYGSSHAWSILLKGQIYISFLFPFVRIIFWTSSADNCTNHNPKFITGFYQWYVKNSYLFIVHLSVYWFR